MTSRRVVLGCSIIFASVLQIACGGGGDEAGTPNPPPPPTYTIGGEVSGLKGTGLVINLNGSETLDVDENGAFAFVTEINSGGTYTVEVVTQPDGQLCDVSAGTGQATGNVTSVTVSCVNAITLSGQVIDDPIPFALVTVTVGARAYSTTADGEGRYLLQIGGEDDDVVIARAQGSDGQAYVDLRRLLGTFAAVSAEADITHVTTARFALMMRASGGVAPTTIDGWREAEKTTWISGMLDLAAAIKVIIDNPDFDLPEGFENILEFALDPDAVTAFISDARALGGPFNGVRAAILDDPNAVPGFSVEALTSAYYLVPASGRGLPAGLGAKLELEEDGTGILIESTGIAVTVSASHAFRWELSDGALELDFEVPSTTTRSGRMLREDMAAYGIGTAAQHQQLIDANIYNVYYAEYPETVTYRLLDDGLTKLVVHEARIVRRVFEPVTLPDTSTVQFEDFVTPSRDWVTEMLDPAANPSIPLAAGSIPGEWLMLLKREVDTILSGGLYDAFAGDIVTLTANGDASLLKTMSAANWSLNGNGELVLEYGEGRTMKVTVFEMSGAVAGAFYELTLADGSRYGNYGPLVKAEGDFGTNYFTTGSGERWMRYDSYWNAFYWDSAGIVLTPYYGVTGYQLDEGGASLRHNYHLGTSGPVDITNSPGVWGVSSGVLEIVVDEGTSTEKRVEFIPVAEGDLGFVFGLVTARQIHTEEMRLVAPPGIGIWRKEPDLAADQ